MSELFDDLARKLAQPITRRSALRVAGGALAATVVSFARPSHAAAKSLGSCPPNQLECHPEHFLFPGEPFLCCGPPAGRYQCGPSIRHPECIDTCPKGNPCSGTKPDKNGVTAFKCCKKEERCCPAKDGTVSCCSPDERCDPLTKQCRRPEVCGPDITEALKDVLSRTRTAFAKWSPTQRNVACISLVQTPIAAFGWEINQLGPGGREQGVKNFQPECATCGGSLSVQVGSGCHYAGSVNYVVYGVMMQLCHDELEGFVFTEKEMGRNITIWKWVRQAPNLDASLGWAKAGYNGWPSEPTPRPELPTCEKCPKKLTSRLTVRWQPIDRSI